MLEIDLEDCRRELGDVRVAICEHYEVEWEAVGRGAWEGLEESIWREVRRLADRCNSSA